MVVRDEIKRLALFLKAHGRLHRAEIIADVEFSAGLETGENSHGADYGTGTPPGQAAWWAALARIPALARLSLLASFSDPDR
jgi:hypothetical protein